MSVFTDEVLASFTRVPGVRGATAGSVPPDSDLISFGTLVFADRSDAEITRIIGAAGGGFHSRPKAKVGARGSTGVVPHSKSVAYLAEKLELKVCHR